MFYKKHKPIACRKFALIMKALLNKIFPPKPSAPNEKEASHSSRLSGDLVRRFNQSRPMGPQEKLCWAPFRSIYFGHYGAAVACCYNRQHVLGKYPERSIKEIWFGEEAEALREKIGQNDLSLGCRGCQTQLEAGNFDAVKAKQYDEIPSNDNGYPGVMEFELSNLCNLECEMCSGDFSNLIRQNREKREPMKIPYDQAFLDQLDEFIPYLTEVKFYGGEPFLIELYYQIWEKIMAKKPDIRISVQTNATILNNRVKNILAKTNFHINISLDSLQKETYESIRINAKFERVMENVQWFREYCREKGTFFGISMCAMRNNWRELPDFVTLCNDMNVPVYFHTVFFPEHLAIRTLPAAELTEIIGHLKQFDFPEGNAVLNKNRRHYQHLILQVESWCADAMKPILPPFHVNSLQELREIVLDRIRENASGELDFQKRKATIDAKFEQIEAQFPDKEEAKRKLQTLDLNKGDLLETIVYYYENKPVEELSVSFARI